MKVLLFKKLWVIVVCSLVLLPIVIGLISREVSYYEVRHYDGHVNQKIGVVTKVVLLDRPFYKFYEPKKLKIMLDDDSEFIILSDVNISEIRSSIRVIILTAKFNEFIENGVPISVAYSVLK